MSPDRLTDHQARSLLQAAAETVAVPPAPVRLPPEPPRSRWGWAGVAAATVAVVAVTSVAVSGGLGGVAPSFDPSPTPVPDRATATPWSSVELADDQLPSVFGYAASDASDLLRDAGLEVDTGVVASDDPCRDVGRALVTDPAVGTTFEPGDTATLVVGDAGGTCTAAELQRGRRLWGFVDFAAGRSTPPEFATNVTFSVNGDAVSLSARQAQDPSLWPTCSPELTLCPGNAADVVAAASRRVQRVGSGYRMPTLESDGTTLTDSFTIDFPVEGIAFYPRWQVTLDWRSTDQGRSQVLAGVALSWLEAPSASTTSNATVPSVTATPRGTASAALAQAGLTAREERIGGVPLGCFRDYYVVSQNPQPGTEVARGTPVLLLTRLLPCDSDETDPIGVGAGFVAWARGGGEPPPFADGVRMYVGNRHVLSVAGAALASDPRAWQVPAPGRDASGTVSALAAVADSDADLVTSLAPHTAGRCPETVDPLPDDTGGLWVQVLDARLGDDASCIDALQVQLWLDADDRISAVNLLLGSP